MSNLKSESEEVAREFFQIFKNGAMKNAQSPNTDHVRNKGYMEQDVESFRKLLKTGIVNDMLAIKNGR